MCCSPLLNNAHKAQKYKMRHTNRYKNICESKHAFRQSLLYYRAFDKIKPQSKVWLKSPEFKAKYIDTNHPYPPLLNPQNIDYDSIPAELAWDMNLPLPPHYDLIYFVIWGCASNSTFIYFLQDKLRLSPFLPSYAPSEQYKQTFDFLNNVAIKNKKILLIHSNTWNFIGEKYLNLVTKNAPLFLVTRDPISIMKTWANHTKPNPNRIKEFNLTFDYHKVLDCIVYEWSAEPNMETKEVHLVAQSNSFTQSKFLQYFANNEKIIIDAKDLSADNAYQTMQNLGKKLQLDKKDYAKKSNTSTFHNIFPYTLICNSNDLAMIFKDNGLEQRNKKSLRQQNGIQIIITDGIRGNEWRGNSKYVQLNGIESQQILFFIRKKDAQKLYDNNELFEATKRYLQGFIKALDKRIALEAKKQLTEKDILEYFSKNKDKRQEYKVIFDDNLAFIKELRPDIVASWKYYNEFEKMCVALDSS